MHTPAPTDPPLRALRQRLERWELQHLRDHAAELADRLERVTQERDNLLNERDAAWRTAEHWHEQAMQLVEDLHAIGAQCGLTPDGQLIVHTPAQEQEQEQEQEHPAP